MAQTKQQRNYKLDKSAKFKLVRGHHFEGGNETPGPDGKPLNLTDAKPLTKYVPGDIITSNIDLAAKFNSPGSIKFQRLDADLRPQDMTLEELQAQREALDEAIESRQKASSREEFELDPDLMKMTLPKLLELAENEEINLGDAKKKEDVVRAIQAADAAVLNAI